MQCPLLNPTQGEVEGSCGHDYQIKLKLLYEGVGCVKTFSNTYMSRFNLMWEESTHSKTKLISIVSKPIKIVAVVVVIVRLG